MTMINGDPLQEKGIGLTELFKVYIALACREKAVNNLVVRYIIHKLGTDAVACLTVAGEGLLQHI